MLDWVGAPEGGRLLTEERRYTVSYTHLDVYKRQVKTSAVKSTILPITWSWVYAALPVGMVLMLISMASVFLMDVRSLKERIDGKGGKYTCWQYPLHYSLLS